MIDYKSSGVDIDKGNRIAAKIKQMVKTLPHTDVVSSIGGFGAIVSLKRLGCDIVVSSTTDGVGTKLLVAQKASVHNTVGIDLVAMNVNDIITTGSEPLFFLDYISYSNLEDTVIEEIVKGIVDGLKQADCALVGGETAQMPGIYKEGEYDLAGFCVGIGTSEDILPKPLREGMAIVGFESSGFHSNGYSLLRKVFFDILNYTLDREFCGKSLGEILLEPTRIYVNLFKKIRSLVKALVHITGGGFYDNIPRVLGGEFDAIIYKNKLPEMCIFNEFRRISGVDDREMFRTFNMGIGMVAICDIDSVGEIVKIAEDESIRAYEMGFIEKGKGDVIIV